MSTQPAIRFSVIGLNHGHIFSQVNTMLQAGAELVSFYAKEPDLAERFALFFPDAVRAREEKEILEDESVHLLVSAAIFSERQPLGIAAMRHGKDFMSDKPAFTTLDQLAEARRVQAETGRIYSICYSERFENPASVRAGELVKSWAIGQVIQTIGMGPHRLSSATRPEWFWQREKYGGIINDIGSHQMDQFLYYTGSTQAEIVAAQVANYNHPEYPEFEDFGDVMLRSDHASGYIRVDWFTPDGLATWGDGRLFILGTEGYIETRKYIDIAGKEGANHLFWTDGQETHYEDCTGIELPYGRQLVYDILNRTETAMPQEHAFLASELALKAQAQATRLTGQRPQTEK